MAVGIDLDTERITRTGIPGGGAGTLSDGAFKNTFVGVWLYRPTSGNSYGLTSDGYIISGQAGAREIKLGFDNTFGAGLASSPNLNCIFDSGGGAGATQTFASANFLDEWVYYFYLENSTTGQTFGYIRLSSPSTAVTLTRTNSNAGSQYINGLGFGNHTTGGVGVFGHYAYGRARYATGITTANAVTWSGSSTTVAGDWGFWPFDNNADNVDDSGNARNMTFTGTLTTETSPTLGGGGGPTPLILPDFGGTGVPLSW